MTNNALSIQVLDVTKGVDVKSLRELVDLESMPPMRDPSFLLAVIQCDQMNNNSRFPLCSIGIWLETVYASFRSING